MYQFFIDNPIFAAVFIMIVAAVFVAFVIKALQRIGLEKVRAVVYDGFVRAENEFKYGDNSQKFEYVVQLARSSLPAPFNLLVTETLLRSVIQLWFDLIKDILDNGKIDGTKQEE